MLQGFTPQVSAWVKKHFVEAQTAPVFRIMQWARQAEKSQKNAERRNLITLREGSGTIVGEGAEQTTLHD